MKLGIITDIHEDVENLKKALDRFKAERVDQIVVIGDILRTGDRIVETCQRLADARAVGVWGNHDFGLCVEPDARFRSRFGEDVIKFMASLKPRLEIEGCYFAHVEPWLNPEDISDLWYIEGPPEDPGQIARIFDAVPNRLMFSGHHHCWQLVMPHEISDWSGQTPVQLSEGRFFVIVGPLCEGQSAMLDTRTWELIPFNDQAR